MTDRFAALQPLWFALLGLALALGIGLTTAEGLARTGRFPAASRVQPANPGNLLRQAQAEAGAGLSEEALASTRRAIALAPYWGAGWVLAGVLIERTLGRDAALPWYDRAWTLDRFSRHHAEIVAPPLQAAGWLDQGELVWRTLRLSSVPLARLLPANPTVTGWPDAYTDQLDNAALSALFGGERDGWLVALERNPGIADFDPERRATVLSAVCRADSTLCLERLRACAATVAPCQRGVTPTPTLIAHASTRALEAGQLALAEAWAREARAFPNDAGLVRHLAQVLEYVGKRDEARQLRRLHPAFAADRAP